MGIRGFDNIEDMYAAMAEDERRANAAVRPRQQAKLGWGTYGFRFASEVPVWTQIYTEEEAAKGEDRETIRNLRDSHERGYRYGMHYSTLCPEGELGSAHISTMWPISREDFNTGKMTGWYPTRESSEWFSWLLERMAREMVDDAAGITHSKFDADEDEGQTFTVVDEGNTP